MTTAEREAAELVARRVLLPLPDVIAIVLNSAKCTDRGGAPGEADHICPQWLELVADDWR